MKMLILLCRLLIAAGSLAAQQDGYVHDGYIQAGRLSIHYREAGRGAALVLLHAGFQDAGMWRQQVNFFREGHRVIAIDLPGHGGSTGMDTSILVQDVLRTVFDSLKIDKAYVVGLSLGSVSALDLTLAYPSRVIKLVMVSCGLTGAPDVVALDTLSRRLFEHSDSLYGKPGNDPAKVEWFTHLWCDGPYRSSQQVPKTARAQIEQTTATQLPRGTAGWPRFNPEAQSQRIATLKTPLLIIDGALDLPYIRAIGEYLHQHVAGSRLIIVPDVAHMLNLEQPAAFNLLLADFFGV